MYTCIFFGKLPKGYLFFVMLEYDAIVSDNGSETSMYHTLVESLNGEVLVNPTVEEARDLLLKSNKDVILFGHGDCDGLLKSNLKEHLIDKSFASLLKTRNVIGIWCYASDFADANDLHGFFTSMFVSNVNEAYMLHMFDAEKNTISSELKLFLEKVNKLMRDNVALDKWVMALQNDCDKSLSFVRYNYEALSYFP